MKKFFVIMTIAFSLLGFVSATHAELKLSGNITTGAGYQHDNQNAALVNNYGLGVGGLTQGDMTWRPLANGDHFGFFVDQVELDVDNEFGDNIRARADIDFNDLGTPSLSNFNLEQGYVTANITVGNGMEFLIGKFNAPMGMESVDRAENVFVSSSPSCWYLLPMQLLGTKIYYSFNDHWNMDLAVANSLNNTLTGNSAYPSGILRFGATWGTEARESYFHIAGGFGPEHNTAVAQTSQNRHFDMMGVLWGNFALGDYWDLGYEVIYRQTNAMTDGTNQRAMGGQLFAQYQTSKPWTLQARGVTHWEFNAPGADGASTTGGTWSPMAAKGRIYSGTIGATYKITDGADMKFEYRFDFAAISGAANANFHTGLVAFAYSF